MPRKQVADRHEAAGHQAPCDRSQPVRGRGIQAVEDPLTASLGGHDAGLAQDSQMMGDRGLANVARLAEIAGAGLHVGGEPADDGQPGRIGEGGKQANFGIEAGGSGLAHWRSISADFDIDKVRYIEHIDVHRYRSRRHRA